MRADARQLSGMSLDGDIALLKRVPLFGELPTEQLRLIAFSAVRLELVAGQVLFREGGEGAVRLRRLERRDRADASSERQEQGSRRDLRGRDR